jgi:hypothetical protein
LPFRKSTTIWNKKIVFLATQICMAAVQSMFVKANISGRDEIMNFKGGISSVG